LSQRAREIFIARANELYLSVASVWEILIKVQLKKLPFPEPAVPFLRKELVRNNVVVLPVMLDHIARLENLPRHHRDPFDRILIAQALEEDLSLISADPLLAKYPIRPVW
jgi:PIN domain nuclease of toxin-antitoxin system